MSKFLLFYLSSYLTTENVSQLSSKYKIYGVITNIKTQCLNGFKEK